MDKVKEESASETITDVMDRNVLTHPQPTNCNGIKVSNLGYINNMMCINKDTWGVIFSCMIIKELWRSYPLKHTRQNQECHLWLQGTGSGLKKWQRSWRINQGFRVQIEKAEKYLGVKIMSGDIEDSKEEGKNPLQHHQEGQCQPGCLWICWGPKETMHQVQTPWLDPTPTMNQKHQSSM